MEPGHDFIYSSDGHSKSVLQALKEQREENEFCDVLLRVEDHIFPAHKCVLAALTPFFKAMFTSQMKESHDREVTLNDIEPLVLEDLLQFAYTGSVSITQANVESLMAASNLLQVLPLRDACSQFMEKHMDASNCLGIHCFAETMNCDRLQEAANAFALRRYQQLPERRRDMQGARTRPRNAQLVDVIVCVGGNAIYNRDYVEAFDPASNQWTSLANLPYPVRNHGCVVTGKNVLYVAGGESEDEVTNKLLVFYPQSNKWEEMTGMSCARQYHGMAVLDGFVYAVGGQDGRGRLNSVERFNTETNIWEEMPGMMTGVSGAAMVAHDGYLYVAGGYSAGGRVACVQRFDPRTRTWSEVAPMLSPRSDSVACVLDGKIYIIGGWGATRNSVNTVECYDSHHNQWSPCSPVRAARCNHGAVVMHGHIYVFGGCDESITLLKSVERYTPSADRWEHVTDMTSARRELRCAMLQVPRSLLVSGKR